MLCCNVTTRLNIPSRLHLAFRKPEVDDSYKDCRHHIETENPFFVHTGAHSGTSVTKKGWSGCRKLRTRRKLEVETNKGSRSEKLRWKPEQDSIMRHQGFWKLVRVLGAEGSGSWRATTRSNYDRQARPGIQKIVKTRKSPEACQGRESRSQESSVERDGS